MGLTANQKLLIEAIAKNNISKAKECAISCVEEDTTQKNAWWCKQYKKVLESNTSSMIELPYNLRDILAAEDVSNSFREGRYYLSERENAVLNTIMRMNKVSLKLMELGIPYTNSTLLYGESGTGKTTFGRYVAYKTGLPFCYLNFSGIMDSRMGATAQNISHAFAYACEHPCVFMLDEIDCISIKRSGGSSGSVGGEMARITITLLQEFEKLPNNLIIIGATNRFDRIDEALIRRFSIKHEVLSLSPDEKKELVRKYIADIGITFTEQEMQQLLKKDMNQSGIINELIRMIAWKLFDEAGIES